VDPTKITLVFMECYLNEKLTTPSIPTNFHSSSVNVGGLRLWYKTMNVS
jgi:hypothetical protein